MIKTPPRQFRLSPETTRKLDSLVDQIESNPGEFVDPAALAAAQAELDVKGLVDSLPPGLTEDDLVGILKLAFLTECATESYAVAIGGRARAMDAGWLERFNARVWVPDELTHHVPYKYVLMSLGFTEAELDAEVRETRAKQYEHVGGETPVHVTTFGMIQEYLTDNWHGLISRLLRPASPAAAQAVNLVKRRETLHTIWYRDMTALQVEADPSFVEHVSDEVVRFRMPGNSLVPDLQLRAKAWFPLLGGDFRRITKDVLRLMHETLSNTRLTGEMVVGVAASKGITLGPFSVRQLKGAIDRLGGPGYGLLGEAVLEKAGLGYLFAAEATAADGRGTAVYLRLRGVMRSWLADQLVLRAESL